LLCPAPRATVRSRVFFYLCVCIGGLISLSCIDIRMTNVPDIRVEYRYETLQSELQFVETTGNTTSV
jgi:hypothetical protein